MLEKFSQFPKSVFNENHNTLSGEMKFDATKTAEYLRRTAAFEREEAARVQDEELKALWARRADFNELLVAFIEKYDGTAAYDLIRTFERHFQEKKE